MSAGAWARTGAATLLVVVAGGCAHVPGGVKAGPAPAPAAFTHLPPGVPLRSTTLEDTDRWLRHYVMSGQEDSLAAALDGRRPRVRFGDDLQQMLQLALAAHQAGEYERSNQLFEEAEREADARYTRSVSQIGLSFLTSDRAVDWVPSRAEMSMIPYYRISNYLRLDDLEGALVEARKASGYLARLDDATGDPCRSSTFMKYLTGLLYEMGGETNDAVVAMRQAEEGFRSCEDTYGFGPPAAFGADLLRISQRAGMSDVAREAQRTYKVAPAAAPAGTGEVVVLVENGFVAHRAEQSVFFPIFDGDVAGLDIKNPLAVLATSAELTARVINNLVERDLWGASFDDLPQVQLDQAAQGAYIMKMVWPAYRLEANGAERVRVVAAGATGEAVPVQDLSGEVIRDFEAQRKAMIARTIGRGIIKYVGAKEIEDRVSQRNPLLGLAAGFAANLGANALEKADTRSWSLLPDRMAMARVRLPAGEHEIRAEILDASGQVVATEVVGTVTVEAGKAQMLTHRVWGRDSGDRARLARAASGVEYDEVKAADGEAVAMPETPAASTPAASTPAASTPAASTPAASTPAASDPAASTLVSALMASQSGAEGGSARPAGQAAADQAPAAPAAEPGPVMHNFAVMPFNFLQEDGGFGFEYERTQNGVGIGVLASSYWYDYDVSITALAGRARRYFGGEAHRGWNMGVTLGLAGVCDDTCTYGSGSERFGTTNALDGGYSFLLGPVALRLTLGAQVIILVTPADEEASAYGPSDPVGDFLFTPIGGLSVGWVLGR